MEGVDMPYNPRTVEHVFKDYKARRAAMLRALTDDVEEFSRQCDPDKENLCLYGYPNEEWEVNFPAEEVPPELPEPALGINFARDGMQRKDWLSLVAVHSDVWLYAVAFFYGARFDKYERKRLFGMINELPTLFDLVSGRKTVKEKGSVTNSESKVKTPGNLQKSSELQAKSFKPAAIPPKDEEPLDTENDDEEHGDTTCGSCGRSYNANEFWICCDACEKWFHGKCVKITAAKAEHIKQYICPRCSSNKRART